MNPNLSSGSMSGRTNRVSPALPREVPDTSRIVVVEAVTHQHTGDPPHQTQSRFGRQLTSTEQPYSRKARVGEEWKPIDSGWIDVAGMMIIENLEGRFTQVIPTPEKKAEAMKKILLLGILIVVVEADGTHTEYITPFSKVLPGESDRFHPTTLKMLRICCMSGEARYTATIYPE